MSRPGIEPGSQDLASCAITARPPLHDTTGPRHRAFDVFQGSCYTILLPSARHPARASKPSSATSVTGIRMESGAREETGRFRDVKRCVATGDLLTCFRVPVTPRPVASRKGAHQHTFVHLPDIQYGAPSYVYCLNSFTNIQTFIVLVTKGQEELSNKPKSAYFEHFQDLGTVYDFLPKCPSGSASGRTRA